MLTLFPLQVYSKAMIWPFMKQNKIWYFWWNFNSEKPKSKFIFETAVNVRKSVPIGIIDLDMLNLKGSKLLKVTTISHNIWKMCNLGKWNDTIRNSKLDIIVSYQIIIIDCKKAKKLNVYTHPNIDCTFFKHRGPSIVKICPSPLFKSIRRSRQSKESVLWS